MDAIRLNTPITLQQPTIQEALSDIVKNPNSINKKLLETRLNTEKFSPETLHSLLNSAYSRRQFDMLKIMIESKSFTPALLAHIAVEEVNNWKVKKDGFVSVLINLDAFKEKALNLTLLLAVSKGVNLDGALDFIKRLIELGANLESTDENGKSVLEIANECSPRHDEVIGYLLQATFKQNTAMAMGKEFASSTDQKAKL